MPANILSEKLHDTHDSALYITLLCNQFLGSLTNALVNLITRILVGNISTNILVDLTHVFFESGSRVMPKMAAKNEQN